MTGTETSLEHLELGIFVFLTPVEYFPCNPKTVYREQEKQWEIFQSGGNPRPEPDLAELQNSPGLGAEEESEFAELVF